MTAMGGELGMGINLGSVPAVHGLPDTKILYSESAGRFVLTVNPANRDSFEKIFDGLKIGCVGHVTESPLFRVQDVKGATMIEEDVFQLKERWKEPFGGLI
jgi:phosphoribosylformylglycinamidine synthase